MSFLRLSGRMGHIRTTTRKAAAMTQYLLSLPTTPPKVADETTAVDWAAKASKALSSRVEVRALQEAPSE